MKLFVKVLVLTPAAAVVNASVVITPHCALQVSAAADPVAELASPLMLGRYELADKAIVVFPFYAYAKVDLERMMTAQVSLRTLAVQYAFQPTL